MKRFSEIKVHNITVEKIQKELNPLINSFKNAESFEEQKKIFKKINKIMDDLQTDISIIYVRYTINTTDAKYKKLQEHLDEISPYISAIANEFNKAMVESKFKDDFIKKYGDHLFKMIETSLKCFDEKIIPELQEINKLTSEYTTLVASSQLEYKGQTYTLTQLGKFSESLDRNERKKVAQLSASFFEENDAKIGEIYDKLVKLRTSIAHKLGFPSFIELGYLMLGRTDYDAKMVENYREQIKKDLVPFTQKLFKRQAKRLHLKNPQYYDFSINFLSGNAKPNGDKDFMVKQAQKMYHELSKETDYFFSFMVENELMDLEAKPGKAPGGYMTYFPKYKAPFIFSNFNGTSADVDVLTHEFGHAFQGYMSRNIEVPDYRSPTLEACEMHSMSMEFITYPWMNLFFGENEEKYRYAHLVDAICFIPYGATVDEFQHWVYAHPEASHEERCKAYKQIEEQYLPHKKYDNVEIYQRGRFWMKQRHIIESPFYYIDYTLAQVVAFQFFNEDCKNHEKAWKKYVRLCKLGGKYPFTELLEKAHINNPFVDGTIKKTIKPLKKYLDNIDDMKY